MNRRCACLLLLVMLSLGACTTVENVPATQLLVSVTSEFSDVASVEVQLFDETEQRATMARSVDKAPPFTFAVLPPAQAPAVRNMIVLRAKDAAGTIVAVSKAVVSFQLDRLVEVELRFAQVCRGITACMPGFSCTLSSGGQCGAVPFVAGRAHDAGQYTASAGRVR